MFCYSPSISWQFTIFTESIKSIYPELALDGRNNECARTDSVFFPISQVCTRGVTLIKLPRISLYLQAAASSARLKGGSARLERTKNSRNSADKTTRLLVGILVLFLIAEVPQVKWVDI